MQLTCPQCQATYDVPDGAIGPEGRKVRCRACDARWFQAAATVASYTPPPIAPIEAPAEAPVEAVTGAAAPRRVRAPWLLLALAALVIGLGVCAAVLIGGADQVADRLGIGGRRVPLGIAITREPDWRTIAGGSQLFAVSGRIWNPTGEQQAVPDIRAELKDAHGKTVYAWTITRPVARLAPGQSTTFDGAAVDVPASSSKVNVSFVGADGAL